MSRYMGRKRKGNAKERGQINEIDDTVGMYVERKGCEKYQLLF